MHVGAGFMHEVCMHGWGWGACTELYPYKDVTLHNVLMLLDLFLSR